MADDARAPIDTELAPAAPPRAIERPPSQNALVLLTYPMLLAVPPRPDVALPVVPLRSPRTIVSEPTSGDPAVGGRQK